MTKIPYNPYMGTPPPENTDHSCGKGDSPASRSTECADTIDLDFGDSDRWRLVNISLGAAASIYCGVTLLREHIYLGLLGFPRSIERSQLPAVAAAYGLVALMILLPTLTLVAYALFRNDQQLRRRIVPKARATRVTTIFFIVAASGLVLNNLNLWPFTWRDPDNGLPMHIAAMLHHGEWIGLGLLIFRIVVVVPIIEEVIFRYWFLHSAVRVSGTRRAGILLSATVFSVMHLGLQPFGANWYAIANAAWLFVFSIYFARHALSNNGAITKALIAHASRNILEITTLLYAVSLV